MSAFAKFFRANCRPLWAGLGLLAAALVGPEEAPAAMITGNLTGTNATGGINIIGFDNEISEPNATPPSGVHVYDGNSSSHGFPYFRYQYHPNNSQAFNDYAGLWSIIVSSHTVADPAYYQSLLQKAGAVAYSNLTLGTQVLHPDPGAFAIGSISYNDAQLTKAGTEILGPTKFSLSINRDDYSFNVLNESTAPGTWTGYPYYYWGIDHYQLAISNISGKGLTFVNGMLTSMDLIASVRITSPMAPTTVWNGLLTFSGSTFTFNINESEYINNFGDLHIVMDRTGTINLGAVPEPGAGLLLLFGLAGFLGRRSRPAAAEAV